MDRNTWSDGYNVDCDYIDTYFSQLNPLFMNLNLTFAGIDAGEQEYIGLKEQGKSYLELGFGRGISLCVHALAYDMEFVGTDFNPSHALYAKNLIAKHNANIRIYDESFEVLYKRLQKEEAQFDYIALHGIWSWITPENQRILLDIIRDHLKVGGIVYMSYNCFPGWDGRWSSRKLLSMYHEYTKGNASERIYESLAFFKDFLQTKPLYLQNNPSAAGVMQMISQENLSYIVHEFFHRDTNCCYFTDMARYLESCKLQFACSANPLWHFEDSNLNAESKQFLDSIHAPLLKEQLKDYCFNRGFRNDLFVRGKIALTANEIYERFLHTDFALTNLPDTSSSDFDSMRKELISFFASNEYAPKSAKEAHKIVSHISITSLAALFADMITDGYLHPARKVVPDSITSRAQSFNHAILRQQSQKQASKYLIAPLIGGGIFVDDITQFFLYGLICGKDTDKLVAFAWDILCTQKRSIYKNGKPLEGEKENKEELTLALQGFLPKIALYKTLCVI